MLFLTDGGPDLLDQRLFFGLFAHENDRGSTQEALQFFYIDGLLLGILLLGLDCFDFRNDEVSLGVVFLLLELYYFADLIEDVGVLAHFGWILHVCEGQMDVAVGPVFLGGLGHELGHAAWLVQELLILEEKQVQQGVPGKLHLVGQLQVAELQRSGKTVL